MIDAIEKYFDAYNRTARIYPACIVFAPAVWTVLALFPGLLSGLTATVAVTVGLCAAVYLFSSLARLSGKQAEERLLKLWGEWPTTRLLRHRDRTIDDRTKARYHIALGVICDDLVIPSVEEERTNPAEADLIYRSATKRLIEARRGDKYQLLHHENASYGFRRNLYGLRWVGMGVGFAAAFAASVSWWAAWSPFHSKAIFFSDLTANPALPTIAALDLFWGLFLAVFVTARFVERSAMDYAQALLRTLEPVTLQSA